MVKRTVPNSIWSSSNAWESTRLRSGFHFFPVNSRYLISGVGGGGGRGGERGGEGGRGGGGGGGGEKGEGDGEGEGGT